MRFCVCCLVNFPFLKTCSSLTFCNSKSGISTKEHRICIFCNGIENLMNGWDFEGATLVIKARYCVFQYIYYVVQIILFTSAWDLIQTTFRLAKLSSNDDTKVIIFQQVFTNSFLIHAMTFIVKRAQSEMWAVAPQIQRLANYNELST